MRAEDQRDGEILLRVLQLGVDRRGDDPALISEGEGGDAGKNAGKRALAGGGGGVFGCVDIVEHARGGAGGEADDDADDGHEKQRDELNDRHADLQLAGQLGAEHVDAVADHQEARSEAQRLGADGAGDKEVHRRDAAELTEEDGREKGQDRCEAGIVDRGHEPADIIGIVLAQGDLGVVDDAADLFEFRAQLGENERADDTDQTDERDDQNALQHIAAREREDLAALDENAGADDDADDHRDRGRQTVAFFHGVFAHQHHGSRCPRESAEVLRSLKKIPSGGRVALRTGHF